MDWSPKLSASSNGPPATGCSPPQADPCGANRILTGLPRPEVERLYPALSRIALSRGRVVANLANTIDSLYFPLGGMIARFTVMTDGRTVVVGATGREGFVGVPAVLGADMPPNRAVSLIAGDALELPAAKLPGGMADNPQFAINLRRYCNVYFAHVAQIGACNALHNVQQRVALWLLLTRDYGQSDSALLTHELLSELLGCRRPSVSEALSVLENAGVIRGGRGEIEITEPSRLADMACECYEALRVDRTSR